MRRACAEYLAEAETLLAQSKVNLEQQRRIIARRRKLGSDLTESFSTGLGLELSVFGGPMPSSAAGHVNSSSAVAI
jgi:hypothetical protein